MYRITSFEVLVRETPDFQIYPYLNEQLLAFLKTVYLPICTHYASALSTFVKFYDNQLMSRFKYTLFQG